MRNVCLCPHASLFSVTSFATFFSVLLHRGDTRRRLFPRSLLTWHGSTFAFSHFSVNCGSTGAEIATSECNREFSNKRVAVTIVNGVVSSSAVFLAKLQASTLVGDPMPFPRNVPSKSVSSSLWHSLRFSSKFDSCRNERTNSTFSWISTFSASIDKIWIG